MITIRLSESHWSLDDHTIVTASQFCRALAETPDQNAAKFAIRDIKTAFLVSLATVVGAGISMGFSEAL